MRAKKVKGDPEQGNQGSEEEVPFAKPVESTTKDREKRIKELEELVGHLRATISFLRSDKTFMHGAYDAWPQLFIGDWSKSLGGLLFKCHNWSSLYGFSNRTGKYAHLSKEQKKRLISNMEGYVLQDDFDKIVSQLPPNIRCGILKYFAGIIVVKEIFDLFFPNPFWYLEWPDNQSPNDGKGSGVETPFGAQLNHLYDLFLQSELLPKGVILSPVHQAYRIFFLSGTTACSSLAGSDNTSFQCNRPLSESRYHIWAQEPSPPRSQGQASRRGQTGRRELSVAAQRR